MSSPLTASCWYGMFMYDYVSVWMCVWEFFIFTIVNIDCCPEVPLTLYNFYWRLLQNGDVIITWNGVKGRTYLF